MKKINQAIILFILAFVFMGAGTSDNIYRIKGKNPALDVTLKMGTGGNKIRVPSGGGDLEVSNDDGVSFKKIGAGGGTGGINILKDSNPDLESGNPPADWTASGGAFVAETSAPGFDNQSGSWDASAGGQTLDSALIAVPKGLEGRHCNAIVQGKYAAGAGGDYKAQVLDSGDNVLTQVDINVTNVWFPYSLAFTCPTADSIRVRLISTVDGGIVLYDNVELGRSNFVDVSQTELVASAYYANTTNCVWIRDNASWGDFPADSDCPAITVNHSTQAVNTSDDDLPNIVFDNLTPGVYMVQAIFPGSITVSETQPWGFSLYDGTTQRGECGGKTSLSSGSNVFPLICSTTFTHTGGAKTFSMQGFESSTGSLQLFSDFDGRELHWKVVKYPSASAEAITLETVGWHVDVNIGGANPSLGGASVATYTQVGDTGLDMVLNTGSASAQMPCANGTASEGLTCNIAAVAENVGVVFDIPSAGRYKVCAEFSHETSVTAGNANTAFQIGETTNTSTTLVSEGNSRVAHYVNHEGTTNAGGQAFNLCGMFNWTSVGQKTIRLMYEQAVGGTVDSSAVRADRTASTGQRDIHITVEKMSQQFPTPVWTDLTNSLNNKLETNVPNLQMYTAVIQNAGTPTILIQDGTWIDSITDSGVGDMDINFVGGVFSATPRCFLQFTSINRCGRSTYTSTSVTSVDTTGCSSTTPTDADFMILCIGEK